MKQIAEFESCVAAAKSLNVHKAVVSRACLHNKLLSGFFWKYERDINT